MKQYLDLAQRILTSGVHKKDRTGTGTLSVFGHQMRFDLSQGFPLLTTKKMFWKGVVIELLWFLKGDTNVKYLNDNGVKFWDAWADENGDLGPIYGKQFRKIVHSEWVKPKLFEQTHSYKIPEFSSQIIVDWSHHTTSLLGKTFDSATSGRFTVISEIASKSKKGRTKFVVKFHNTNAERICTYKDVLSRKVKDYWSPSVFGVGCYGNYDSSDKHYELIVDSWREMIRRCYYKESKAYKSYGGKGVHVSEDWLVFANFQKDVRTLPNWELKISYPDEYSLDKDILHASNRYSKETCMWASSEEQGFNTSTNAPFTATDPNGNTLLFRCLGEAKRAHGLNKSAVSRCLKGLLHTHHGWSHFEYASEDGLVLRTRVIDQLRNVIASIKHDPDSRRHIISLWNPGDIDKAKLPPCHGSIIQFYVSDGKLSCQMYQRSGDVFLGVPVNIASYALLLMMIAQVTGLEPGEFIHTIGDAHIYTNHVEQMELQLTREPRHLPALSINSEITDIDDFKYSDFALYSYDPHPHIKGEISV